MRALVHILHERHSPHALWWQHVKAHSGHPWNELVDRLAKLASTAGDYVPNCEPWHSWLQQPAMLTAVQWIWYLEHLRKVPHDAPLFAGSCLEHLVHPPRPCESPLHVPQPHAEEQYRTAKIALKVATINVLTLTSTGEPAKPGITRQRLLLQQFHDEACHIVALQETRHHHILDRSNDLYHILGHPAHQGQDGVQFWISKQLYLTDENVLVQRKHLKVVDSSPTHLIVLIDMLGLRLLLVTGRAPHSGHPEHQAVSFWERISATLRRFDRTWTTIFLGDTNAHLGSVTSSAVGDLAPSLENQAGTVFHMWLLEHDFFVPATFPTHHGGDHHATYVSPTGTHTSRIDYVALPCALRDAHVLSWISDNIDVSLHRPDHLPVLCKIEWSHHRPCHRRHHGLRRINIADFVHNIQDQQHLNLFYDRLPSPNWHLDPHQAALHLAEQTRSLVYQTTRCSPSWRRKFHLLDATWQLIEEKKQAFRQLRALGRCRRHTVVHALFHAWNSTVNIVQTQPLSALQQQLPTWLKLNDHAQARTEHHYKTLSNQVTFAVRQEDARYYAHLAEEAGNTYIQEGLTGLWKRLKAVLPQHRTRLAQQPCYMGDGLRMHFEELEAGDTMSQEALQKECLERNMLDIDARPSFMMLDLSELPTLAEVEELCMKQKTAKSSWSRWPAFGCLPLSSCRHSSGLAQPSPQEFPEWI